MAEKTALVASQLGKTELFRHLRLDETYNANDLDYVLQLRDSAIAYVCDHCGVTAKYVDEHPDLAVAVLCLVADMYDQRDMTAENASPNRTVETILGHHDQNFLGKEAEDASG